MLVPGLDVSSCALGDVVMSCVSLDLGSGWRIDDKRWVEHLEEAGEAVAVAVMGSGSEEQEVGRALGSLSGELPARHIGLAGAGKGMRLGADVGLVDDEDVPIVTEHLSCSGLHVVDGGDHDVVCGPDRLPGKEPPLEGRQEVPGDHGGVEVEKVLQSVTPLLSQAGRNNDEHTPCPTAS